MSDPGPGNIVMWLPSLLDLGEARGLPGDCRFRDASPEDAHELGCLMTSAFGDGWTADQADKSLTSAHDVDRVIVVERNGRFLATASSRTVERFPGQGYLHWVGCLPEVRGTGLGRAVVLAVLEHFRGTGRCGSVLETQDERIPAIGLYLSLGYRPLVVHPGHAKRWADVLKACGWQ